MVLGAFPHSTRGSSKCKEQRALGEGMFNSRAGFNGDRKEERVKTKRRGVKASLVGPRDRRKSRKPRTNERVRVL